MRRIVVSTLLGLGLLMGSAYGEEVIIQTRPPRAIVEHRIVRPSREHVWIGGYHRWDGNAYAWTPGRWELPPRPHAVWFAPRYEHRQGGSVAGCPCGGGNCRSGSYQPFFQGQPFGHLHRFRIRIPLT
jgi:hypothetical protein